MCTFVKTATSAVLAALFALTGVRAAEPLSAVPLGELQALNRAIDRELNTNALGSHTLGELQRLLHRLQNARADADGGRTDRATALAPLGGEDDQAALRRLEDQASSGDRAALRSLALYQLYLNNPEQAIRSWRRMGGANTGDVPYHLLSAYLELALGEYSSAQTSLAAATRLIETRTGLELSKPVFCRNIAGYRLYETRASGDFLPGEDTLVYVEIEGADFLTLPGGDSECRLFFGMTLRNGSGAIVWAEPNYGEYAPLFNGPVRDLHTALVWRVPNDLPPGLYTLAVEATEDVSKRRGETSMEFNLASRPTNPERKVGTAYPPGFNETLREAQQMFPGSTPAYQQETPPRGMPDEWLRNEGYQNLLRKQAQYE